MVVWRRWVVVAGVGVDALVLVVTRVGVVTLIGVVALTAGPVVPALVVGWEI